MALLRARTKDLIINDRENTLLTQNASSGATSITVEDNSGFSTGDLAIIGQLGSESSEIVKVTVGSYGTAMTLVANPITYSGGLIFAHPSGTPIYRIDYDQVEFSRAVTVTGTKTVLATNTIQPDDLFTRYDDTVNTTGYAFFRFKNSISGAFSTYSDAISYGGYDDTSLHKLRERVRRYLKDKDGKPIVFFEDIEIVDGINDAQKELAQEFRVPALWKVASMSSTANQREYGSNFLPSDYWGFLYDCTFNTQPQQVKDEKFYNLVNWNSNTTAYQPSNVYVRNKTLVFWPTPSQTALTTTLTAGISATALTIPVTATGGSGTQAGFPAKGRIKIEDEVIEYDKLDSTNFYLHSIEQRGIEGTTAAAHLISVTVTYRNVLIFYYAQPTKLMNETDVTVFDDPDLVAICTASKMVYNRYPDDKGFIDRLQALRDRKLDLFRKSFGNQYSDNFTRVKRKFETIVDRGIWPQVLNPQNLTQQNP